MKNLLQTNSIAWAHGVRVALEAEGITSALLDEFDRSGMGALAGRVRVVILNDEDLARAQAVVQRLTPPRTPPPPSWRWQKRGLLVVALDFVLLVVWGSLFDRYQTEQDISSVLVYALAALVIALFIAGVLLVILGPRADKPRSSA